MKRYPEEPMFCCFFSFFGFLPVEVELNSTQLKGSLRISWILIGQLMSIAGVVCVLLGVAVLVQADLVSPVGC